MILFYPSTSLYFVCDSYSKYVICEGKFRRTCNRCLGFENWNVAELNVSRAVNYHEMSHIDARFRNTFVKRYTSLRIVDLLYWARVVCRKESHRVCAVNVAWNWSWNYFGVKLPLYYVYVMLKIRIEFNVVVIILWSFWEKNR